MRKETLWRKILPLTLSAAMALSLCPTAVLAAETEDDAVTEESAEETTDSESTDDSSESDTTDDSTAGSDTEDDTSDGATDDTTTDNSDGSDAGDDTTDDTTTEDDTTGSGSGSVTIAGVTYNYTSEAAEGYETLGDTGYYYAVADGETALTGSLYGTADLEYADYYAGDVTEGYEYDAITTATVGDYDMFTYMYDDYDGTQTDGYDILGVTGVNVAVDADLLVTASILDAAGEDLTDAQEKALDVALNDDQTDAPAQYKTLTEDGYGATEYNVVDTVTDAVPEFSTNTTWGEYEIDLKESSTSYLRNSRSDTYTDSDGNTQTFAVGSGITGIILTAEDEDGNEYSVGLTYLANIWIQPYKMSFNAYDTSATKNIAYSGDTAKFLALTGKTITTITFTTADEAYVYDLTQDGNEIYVKPAYTAGSVTASLSSDLTEITIDSATIPEMTNGEIEVVYSVPGTRGSTDYVLYSGSISSSDESYTYTLDTSAIPSSGGGYYAATITSDTYADIDVAIGIIDSEVEELKALIAEAEKVLTGAGSGDSTLAAHKTEAEELVASSSATISAAEELIEELEDLLDPYSGDVTLAGVTYSYIAYEEEGFTALGDTGYYYVTNGTALSGDVYGTADLEYADYYAGDVTEGYEYDAVTTATVGDYDMFTYMYDDYDGTQTDGYDILGVTGVNVAVDADLLVTASILDAAGEDLTDAQEKALDVALNDDQTDAPAQYKTLTEDGYGATEYNVVDTVTDAVPEFSTNTTWGEYEIDLKESSTSYLRNSRSDTYTDSNGNTQTFAVGSGITGIILTAEDEDGNEYSVGLTYLANIWIQPYKMSFNAYDTSATKNIAYSGDTAKFLALTGKTITTITFTTADETYVYDLTEAGNEIYVKPAYTAGSVTASLNDELTTITIDSATVPEMTNGEIEVVYSVPGTRGSTDYVLYSGSISSSDESYTYALDTSVIPSSGGGYYAATITSDTYADIDVAIGIIDSEIKELEALIAEAKAILALVTDETLTAHKEEAEALIASESATVAEAEELIDELEELIAAHNFTITSDAVNGTITAADSATVGDTVTFSVAADYSGSVNSVSVTDANGDKVALTTILEGSTYSFTMPDAAVTINAVFGTVDIDNAKVTLDTYGYIYDGTYKTPEVTVTYKGETVDSEEYYVGYENNLDAGTATVVVEAASDSELFYGSTSVSFTISEKAIYKENVSLSYTSVKYTGKSQTPTVTVTVDGTTLSEGTDYEISYSASSRKAVGTYKITVTGEGNYSGTVAKSYKITKASQTLKVSTSTKTVKYSKVKKAKQTVKAITKVSGAKGTVTYSKVSGSSKLSVNSKTGKITVKKGTKKGTYKIKVKVTSAATGSYNKATKTVTITVKVK